MSSTETCYYFFVFLHYISFHCLGNGFFVFFSIFPCGLENVTQASCDIRVSRKWLKFQFGVNCPFRLGIHSEVLQTLFNSDSLCINSLFQKPKSPNSRGRWGAGSPPPPPPPPHPHWAWQETMHEKKILINESNKAYSPAFIAQHFRVIPIMLSYFIYFFCTWKAPALHY